MISKKKKATRVKKITLAQAKKDVWKVLSVAVRLRDADVHGQVKCISCNYQGYYIKDKIQAGHFFQSRNHPYVRYNFDNLHGQCAKCNLGMHGNVYRYYLGLKEKIGQKRVDTINANADLPCKITVESLMEIKTQAINLLVKESKKKNLKDWQQLFTKKELESWHVSEI